jgi:hypothetical protein
MEREAKSRPGRGVRWRQWRERRKRAARARRTRAEDRLDALNQERYRVWGRGGTTGMGPDIGGGDGGGSS